jgi:hypothetical protein
MDRVKGVADQQQPEKKADFCGIALDHPGRLILSQPPIEYEHQKLGSFS